MSLLKPLVFGKPRREYLKCVMNDAEFKRRSALVHQQLNLSAKDKLYLKKDDVVNVPFINKANSTEIDPKIINEIGSIETDFELGSNETINLLNGELPTPEENTKSIIFTTTDLGADKYKNVLTMYIFESASKRDIIEALDGIEKRIENTYGIKPNVRNKGPQNYQLIYAIHRARRKGKKFSEIFREYGLGTLENYSGARGITSVNKFREYYRKYEPVEPRKSIWLLDADSEEFTPNKKIGIDQNNPT